MMELLTTLQTIKEFKVVENSTPLTLLVDRAELKSLCQLLSSDERFYFDMLSCVTGVDYGPERSLMAVVYHLYSIPYHHHLGLKVELPRENPEVDSLTDIWKSANWMEREVFDMFGIGFINHPDLRRILLPADWDGYPLRKDYQQQEYYRNIKVAY